MANSTTAPEQTSPAKETVAAAPAAKKAVPRKAKAAKANGAAKTAKPAKPVPQAKHKHDRLVRDSFTIPRSEYDALVALKGRANGLAVPAKKSELLRAGVKALVSMDDATFLAALKDVPTIKTGRPAGKAR